MSTPGALAGIGTLGIEATDEVSIAEADDVDAVVYAVNADFRPEASLEEVERVLASGTDVVSTAFHGLLHPPSAPEPLRSRVVKACLEGHSSILVSGIDPGWVLDILPLLLTGVCADIRKYAPKRSPTTPAMTSLRRFGTSAALATRSTTRLPYLANTG
ncbi:MAG: hypothetical protein CM1200mP26_15120 [Acidimicrobiales bacterium]|nr:MAG: hypothetical protein CM1200mP26_15120 [Acidimicrobiales bacterium]